MMPATQALAAADLGSNAIPYSVPVPAVAAMARLSALKRVMMEITIQAMDAVSFVPRSLAGTARAGAAIQYAATG